MKVRICRTEFTVEKRPELKVKDVVIYEGDTTLGGQTPETRLFGSTQSEQDKIFLDARLSPDFERVTFMHEVLHALMDRTSLRIADNNEEICSTLGHLLVEFIQDNPDFVKYLTDKTIVFGEK